MSRKSREDKSSWKASACCYAIVGDYGPYKFRGHKPVADAVLLLIDLSSSSSRMSQQQQDNNNHNNGSTKRSKKQNGFNNSSSNNGRSSKSAAKGGGASPSAVGRHGLFPLAAPCQQVLLSETSTAASTATAAAATLNTLFVLDVRSLFETQEDFQQALTLEDTATGNSSSITSKAMVKPILRLIDRFMFQSFSLVAYGNVAPVALKVSEALRREDNKTVRQLCLVHPVLTTEFCNHQFCGAAADNGNNFGLVPNPYLPVHVVFSTEMARQKRLAILRHCYPQGHDVIQNDGGGGSSSIDHHHTWLLTCWRLLFRNNDMDPATSDENEDSALLAVEEAGADYVNDHGKSLWFSHITVEMSRHTKQYERYAQDITADVWKVAPTVTHDHHEDGDSSEKTNPMLIDWATCPREVGGLVLRGNRCVLVRSLQNSWKGMRIPSVVPHPNETPVDAAIRSIVEYCDVEADEVVPLPCIAPIHVYGPRHRPGVLITLYPLYARQPPPDGPLEDQDMEDEDDSLYDWYTYPNAIKRLLGAEQDDVRSCAALDTMASVLVEAANVGLLPVKWGGVFGQELFRSSSSTNNTVNNHNEKSSTSSPNIVQQRRNIQLHAPVEEWTVSRQADVVQDVRRAKMVLEQKAAAAAASAPLDGQNEHTSSRYLHNIMAAQSKQQQEGGNNKKLPVTVLSGFLGSGKTTLMTHILTNYEGLRVAILVNDMGDINIDAALLKNTTSSNVSVHQREEHMVELSNGCICCTLREDLLTEIAQIAAQGVFDYLLIESSGISEPLPVAETFTFTDSTGLRLGDIAYIDTMVTVVDGSRFFVELQSLESLQERNWQADAADARTISHLLCDQVDFANVVIVNKCDLMTQEQQQQVCQWIQKMNPTSRLVQSTRCIVPLDAVMGTGLFAMSDAEKHQSWLQEARIGEHTPETEEYGISSFTFRALRPFHPTRLCETLEAIASHEQPPFERILRAKGFVWLATRPDMQGDFSLAGNHYVLLPGNPWWATIDKSDWPEGLEQAIAPLWHEPYGDRQQEVVIIGQRYDKESVTSALNDCLLTDQEMELGQEAWYTQLCLEDGGDPFQDTWDSAIESFLQQSVHAHEHQHEHEH
jgi:G3E family GTPase